MWVSDDEIRAMSVHMERLERYMMFYYNPEHSIKREARAENRKWAIIKVGKSEKLVFVDRLSMKAYKVDNYKPTWMEIKNFKFIRWARPMDL